jgi:hypothetical protein
MSQVLLGRTSRYGNHLLPKADIALARNVTARNIRKIWYVVAWKIPTPGADSKTLIHETKNRVLPRLTASVMVIFPTTYDHPQIHEAILRYDGGDSMKVW